MAKKSSLLSEPPSGGHQEVNSSTKKFVLLNAQDPEFGLMPCSHHFEILNHFISGLLLVEVKCDRTARSGTPGHTMCGHGCGVTCGVTGLLAHCWWEGKVVHTLCKTVGRVLVKLNTLLPYGPVFVLPGICPKELEAHVLTDTCSWVILAAFFIIAQTGK